LGSQHADYRIDAGLAVLRGFFGAIMMVLLEVKRGYLWLVRSAKSYRASSWETVNGSVESVTVSTDHAGISDNIGTALADAHLCYSYTSHGEMYGGCFQRMFYDEQRAWDFADQWKGRQVAIRRHPRKPDVSVLRLQDQVGGGVL
jgi:hypothetical protein